MGRSNLLKCLVILVSFGTSASSWAKPKRSLAHLAPDWAKSNQLYFDTNRSYLDNRKCDSKVCKFPTLVESFFDPKVTDSIKLDYMLLQQRIEQQKNYGQLSSLTSVYSSDGNPAEFQTHTSNYIDRQKSYSLTLQNRLIDHEVEAQTVGMDRGSAAQTLEGFAKKVGQTANDIVSPKSEPAPQASPISAVASGTPSASKKATAQQQLVLTQQRPWFEYKYGTKADVEAMRGRIWFQSTLMNSNVDLVASSPLSNQIKGLDRLASRFNLGSDLDRNNNEQVRFQFYRGLPLFELQANWIYGVTSDTATASVSKQFTRYLRGEVAQSQNLINYNGTVNQRVGLFYQYNL